MFKRTALLFSIGVLFCGLAHARGSVGHGGGKVFVCLEDGQEKVYLADTYQLMKSGKLAGLGQAWPDSVVESVAYLLDKTQPEKSIKHPFLPTQKVSLGWMIAHTHANLNYVYVDSLPELDDDNIPADQVPGNCKKTQLAIQDLDKGRVRVVFPLLNKMSMLERGFFELHETAIAMRNAPGADTTPVRKDIADTAGLMTDSSFSAHTMILKILAGPKFVHPTPDPSWASEYVAKHCQRKSLFEIYNGNFGPGEAFAALFCSTAESKVSEDWRRKDRETSLPTLLRPPAVLNCRIMSEARNDHHWAPTEFQVRRTAGRGYRNEANNAYTIQFVNGAPIPAGSGDLITHRHKRQRGIDEIGDMKWVISWSPLHTLFLYKYLQRTGEFIGTVQSSNGSNHSPYSSYGISCHSDKVEFGVDLINSYY